ncbi:MAG: calcineurin-like phosphoesterase family protein [Tannerella sp.]|jgi:hypothetical protein|nr:calcineurin-like phosphoesterase family protein [Tannerella sp.]
MINRRVFIKTGLYAGIGILTSGFWRCSGDDPLLDPAPSPGFEVTPGPGMDLYGLISDSNGNPVEGVVVSDGFQCVVTDVHGVYQMKKSSDATMVFYSTPAEYAVRTANASLNAATFFSRLTASADRYDFTLDRLPQVERDFTLICIGDPQVASNADVARFKLETMSDLKTFSTAAGKPCYGLVLGDVVSDHPELHAQMRILMGSAPMTYFVTIGNHDKTGGSTTVPRGSQSYSSVFGPTDYSFNRGDVHFVCLDNVVFTNNTSYGAGFTDKQVEWLRQDLSHVPKEKMIIVYYHIPIRNTASVKNRTEILNLLKDYRNVHLMCGHTHYSEYSLITTPSTYYEHIHAAACGSWWKSNINGDGAPNGYAVYEISGTDFTDWHYKATGYDRDFQIRLHRGNTAFGGSYGSFTYNQGNNIVANIWNADPKWKLEAYEDGVKAGDLVQIPSANKDAFALGYHIGVLNRNPLNYSPPNHHAYLHTLKNANAQTIEIRATDRFGRVYRQSAIVSDLTSAHQY